jgi:hypothetical protein
MNDADTFAPRGLAERAGMACARCRQFTLLACLVNRIHWPEGGEKFCPGFDSRLGETEDVVCDTVAD